ncbi:reverse transcriptase domain-containing protein [Colwellia sp. PAMC 20917]|uniref:reverse transcriptase domain-containing protein n=1 Tax=Colwellia sp. PAMC 20917 TaxID=1816218 RepID=UPI0018D398CB|nr:reverse transcriptase domain-containing protein [Colwellia sp. PAMC 20917]
MQFIKRSVKKGGTFNAIQCVISRGCSLSPVIAAYYLKGLDDRMAGDKRCFYRRYMDDIMVLAKTRWYLRCGIRTVNQHFNALKVEQAPDKTFIGRIEKQIDFLGYRFGLPRLTLAVKTIINAVDKVRQLYEQKQTAQKRAVALDYYITRWLRCVVAGNDKPIKIVFCIEKMTNPLSPTTTL